MAKSGRILINYRRRDSAAWAQLISRELTNSLGEKSVFIDIEMMLPGEDLVHVSEREIAASAVMICVIGPHWTDSLSNSSDFVRIEIEAALAMGKPIMPFLVDGADFSVLHELPESIKDLSRYNGFLLRPDSFARDISALVDAVAEISQSGQFYDTLARPVRRA